VYPYHKALALDVHAAGTDQSSTLPTRSQQLVGGLADLDAAVWAGALHAGGGVHGVAKQAKLGHAVAHDAGSDGARMDADAHGDRLAIVRHCSAAGLRVGQLARMQQRPMQLLECARKVLQTTAISISTSSISKKKQLTKASVSLQQKLYMTFVLT
jgi:hypothetical protein